MSKIKVLHILGGLSVGGIEKWLLNISKFHTSNEIELHVFSTNQDRVDLIAEFENNFKSVTVTSSNNLISTCIDLYKTIKERKIDIVHSHCDLSSGYYSFILKLLPIKIKFITHSHSDRRFVPQITFRRKLYTVCMKKLISLFSSKNISVSEYAKSSLFSSTDAEIIYCGIPDIKVNNRFLDQDLEDLRKLGTKLIFHVARFNESKNHEFIIDLASKVVNENVCFILLGDGEKFLKIKKITEEKALKNVIFKGSVSNVNEYLINYANLVILPSLWEGLPLTALEAQSIGIYTLLSDKITRESDLGNCCYLNLSLQVWQQKILSNIGGIQKPSELGDFKIQVNIDKLNELYKSLVPNRAS